MVQQCLLDWLLQVLKDTDNTVGFVIAPNAQSCLQIFAYGSERQPQSKIWSKNYITDNVKKLTQSMRMAEAEGMLAPVNDQEVTPSQMTSQWMDCDASPGHTETTSTTDTSVQWYQTYHMHHIQALKNLELFLDFAGL